MYIEIVPDLRPLTEEEVDNYIHGVGLVRFGGGSKFAYILRDEIPVQRCRVCGIPCKIRRTWRDTYSNPENTLFAECLDDGCTFYMYFMFEPEVIDKDVHAIFPNF